MSALDEILIVAAVIAFVAALLGLALTRSSDFVAPDGSSEPSPNAVSTQSQSESATVTTAKPAPSRGT